MRRRVLASLLLLTAALHAQEQAPTDGPIRSRLPDWLRVEMFWLEGWQWIGLLVVLLAGILAGMAGRVLAMTLGQRAARRRGVELDGVRTTGRPFGLVAAAGLWMALLPFLQLPARGDSALTLAAQLVLMVGVVWSVCRIIDWVGEVLAGLARNTSSRIDDVLVPMVRKALKIVVVAMGIVWIADNLDMDIAALMAGLGIGGFALALASKDSVENFFGAISILTDRPFQVGDWIVMGKIEGTVEEVGFRSTRVRTFYNSLITFPNAMLLRTEVDNFGARRYRRYTATLGLTYDTPADKVESFVEGVRELVRRHPYTRKDYYHVYFSGFGESSLDVMLYVFFEAPDWGTELRERQRLLMDILRLAAELKVGFAFPTQTLHLRRDEAPDHGEPVEKLQEAWRRGQGRAGELVERFTPKTKPPPVQIGQRPDEALDSLDDEAS